MGACKFFSDLVFKWTHEYKINWFWRRSKDNRHFVCQEQEIPFLNSLKRRRVDFSSIGHNLKILTNIIIMRTCCCCIPVNAGAMILGIIGFFICALELVGLIPYQLQLNEFNPIQDFVGVNLKTLHEKLDEFLPPIFLGATVEAGVYAISCLL